MSAGANNYISLGAFKPDEAGQFRRQKARFQALYARSPVRTAEQLFPTKGVTGV
jgi:hypothetical protein